MLNEVNEVKAILRGERINKNRLYRSCYLLAKYYKSCGCDFLETRQEIFKWANLHKIFITDDLNSIIQRAYIDKHELRGDVLIKISQKDIDEINKRFDRYNSKLVAFALLCFAKLYANKNGVFCISQVGMANWLRISESNLSGRYIKEMIDFNYLSKVAKNDLRHIKNKNKTVSKCLIYKIRVDFTNEGEYEVRDDNFIKEFEKIFTIL